METSILLSTHIRIHQWALRPSLENSRTKLKELLHSYQLVDIWRILQPQEKDYTFFSPPHGSYSRIDLFLVSHVTIPLVSSAHIGNIALSDHAPISLELALQHRMPRSATWRPNETLLQDPDLKTDVLRELQLFFETNKDSVSSPLLLWRRTSAIYEKFSLNMATELNKIRRKQYPVYYPNRMTLKNTINLALISLQKQSLIGFGSRSETSRYSRPKIGF